MPDRSSVAIDPPLEPAEVTFLSAFTAEADVRRLWPGQPSRRCPWRPSPDGRRLELIEAEALADPDNVAEWLRFLSRRFLAPSTEASLDVALTEGLRCGHWLSGEVVLAGGRRISVDLGRVTDAELSPSAAAVLPLGRRPPQRTER